MFAVSLCGFSSYGFIRVEIVMIQAQKQGRGCGACRCLCFRADFAFALGLFITACLLPVYFLNLFCRLNLFTRTMINPLISVASCRIFVLLMPEYLFTGIKTCTKDGNYAGCMPDCVWH